MPVVSDMVNVVQQITKTKEVIMPGRDKTGPEGLGPFTGRGMGARGGRGSGFGRGGYGQGRRMRSGLGHGDDFNSDEGDSVNMELEEKIKNSFLDELEIEKLSK